MRRRQRQIEEQHTAATARARLASVVAPPARRPVRSGWIPDPPPDEPFHTGAPGDRWKRAAEGIFQRSPRGEWLLGRRHAVVIALVIAAALVGAIAAYVSARPRIEPVTPVTESTGTPLADHAGSGENGEGQSTKDLIVHVAGLVKSPGVVTLPAGSRVVDALEAAGGVKAKADLSLLNLARVLADGEQVLVGSKALASTGVSSTGAGGAVGGGEPGALLNLNTATLEQLETLPGIGPALGQEILDWRTEHGRFSTIDELREVAGIGDVTFGELEPLVTV